MYPSIICILYTSQHYVLFIFPLVAANQSKIKSVFSTSNSQFVAHNHLKKTHTQNAIVQTKNDHIFSAIELHCRSKGR